MSVSKAKRMRAENKQLCPRCSVRRAHHNDSECWLVFSQGGYTAYGRQFYAHLTIGAGTLYWLNSKSCVWLPTSRRPRLPRPFVELPMLPYTVSEEDLQKYMVLV